MKMNRLLYSVGLLLVLFSCSDYDEQEFTVLLPDAGLDQVVFTEDSGTTIQLDGGSSSDVNNIGFDYKWTILSTPEGANGTLSDANSPSPTLEVSNEDSGRYQLSLRIFRGDQIAQDFVNIDVNPAIAQVIFVNAIDSDGIASLSIPSIAITGNPVQPRSVDDRYYNIDKNIAQESDGTVLFEVNYNGNTLFTNQTLEALKSYTMYLAGTSNNPELLFVEKTKNQNTIPIGIVGLDAINLAPDTDNVVLFIDATSAGFGVLPVDTLFGGLGVSEQFGTLNYRDNSEIFFPSNTLIPLPIWATVNGQRISNDAAILLPPNRDGNFGTFMLFPDTSAEFGHTLIFINNSDLLPE